MNIELIMSALSQEYPKFLSEREFQLTLSKEIAKLYPNAVDREVPFPQDEKKCLDLVVMIDGKAIPIELKYVLKSQGATDLRSYAFLQDIARIEKAKTVLPNSERGYCIFLTNAADLWEAKKGNVPALRDIYRIHEGRELSGHLQSALKGAEQGVTLAGKYTCHWNDYSRTNDETNGVFRYLCIEI